jgi:hypothetical protein
MGVWKSWATAANLKGFKGFKRKAAVGGEGTLCLLHVVEEQRAELHSGICLLALEGAFQSSYPGQILPGQFNIMTGL